MTGALVLGQGTMAQASYALFETPIGPCGLVWGAAGLLGINLPEASTDATVMRVIARFPDAREARPQDQVAAAIAGMQALLSGEPRSLAEVVLDMRGLSDFRKRVYTAARTLAPGSTCSYAALAARVGEPGGARAIGQALGANPFPIVVPCHRVVSASGSLGGFSARGGATTKARMLAIEGYRDPRHSNLELAFAQAKPGQV